MRVLALLLVVLGSWVAAFGAGGSDAERVSFDVPATDAESALRAFAKQASIQLLFDPQVVEGVASNSLRGDYPVEEGLEKLLSGRQLEAVRDSATGAYSIRKIIKRVTERKGEHVLQGSSHKSAADQPQTTPAMSNSVSSATPRRGLSRIPLLSAAIGLIASVGSAQEAPKPQVPEQTVVLETYTVSATIAPKRPLDNPASVTTIDSGTVKLQAPLGVPELLKTIPGFYVETAGGETRANVRTRGLFSTGGYTYAGLQEDGLPGITENRYRQTEPDMLIRVTSFVDRVEAVRGGASGVFYDSAPGGLINFITREGGKTHEGNVYLQTTDYGQIKGEVWESGPLTDNTSYALYLGYRRDNGQKDMDYVANHGGSFQGNIKHWLANDRGYLKFAVKYIDDANQFWLPIPLRNATNPSSIPGGPDIKTGSLYSSALRRPFSLNTPNGVIAPDAQKNAGRAITYMATGDLDLKLSDDWKIKNLARFTYVDFRNDVPTLSTVATPLQALANSIASSAGTQFAAALNGGNYSYRLYEGGAAIASPTTLNSNGLGIQQNTGNLVANIDNFQNDFRLIRTTSNKGAVALGLYAAWLNSSYLAQASTTVNSISPHAKPLDFEFLDSATGQSLGYGTYQGVRQLSAASSYRNVISERQQFSPYLSAEQSLGNWTFEGGIRHEELMERISAQMSAANDVNNLNTAAGGNNPALRNVALGSGNWKQRSVHLQDTIWTVAANYKFNEKFGSYVRYMDGYRMPQSAPFFETLYGGTFPPTETIQQWEAGVKYATSKLSVFATVVKTQQQNQLFTGVLGQPDGTLVTQNFLRDSEASSIELEAFYTPFKPLTFHLLGTLQKVKYASDVFIRGTNSVTGQIFAININGNRPIRVPKIFYTFEASYKFPKLAIGEPMLNAQWDYLGHRFGDDANLINLPGYSTYNVGLSLRQGRITYRAMVKNLTNTLGFTEGDPRTSQLVGDPTAAYMNMRTIFPRSFLFSVDYSF